MRRGDLDAASDVICNLCGRGYRIEDRRVVELERA